MSSSAVEVMDHSSPIRTHSTICGVIYGQTCPLLFSTKRSIRSKRRVDGAENMVKTKFTAADTRAMVRDLRTRVLGLRVLNVYDINQKTYTFRLAVSGQEKVVLLMESGMRFHTTKFSRDKGGDMPSPFSMRLRKHLRTKLLEDIRQLGGDRVVDFCFGSGEAANHVILELYAGGNLILTDHRYEIMALLRTHSYETEVSVAVKQLYPVAYATSAVSLQQRGEEGADTGPKTIADMSPAVLAELICSKVYPRSAGAGGEEEGKGGKSGKLGKSNLKMLLLGNKEFLVGGYGPALIEHCILKAGLNPTAKLKGEALTLAECAALLDSLKSAEGIMKDLDVPGQPGYILLKPAAPPKGGALPTSAKGEGQDESEPEAYYEEFLPVLLLQHQGLSDLIRRFDSFDEAVDEFFGKIEDQRLKQAAASAEAAARSRLESVKKDQELRMAELERTQEEVRRQARVVETHSEVVDKAILVLRSAIATGADWQTLEEYVKAEQTAGNPLARLITGLKLDHNKFTMRLRDPEVDSDDEDLPEDQRFVAVDVDLALSAHANSRALYDAKKKATEKAARTVEGLNKALKVVEKQTMQQLNKQQLKRSLAVVRKAYWFEKFNWFITSDNYLVLSGKDAQQNETLVKRYLRPGDAYLHSELQGATSCVVRNKGKPGSGRAISPLALQEAGCMTTCRSAAWKAKVVTSAWWVHSDQVSKMAPTGEYLTTGSFMIRGKKNFLAPHSLEMGLAILFKVDDSCLGNHVNERRERDLGTSAVDDDDGSAAAADVNGREGSPVEAAGADENDGWGPEPNSAGDGVEESKEASRASPLPSPSPSPLGGGSVEAGGGDGGGGADSEAGGKRRVTAKERKLMKKYGRSLEEVRQMEVSQGGEKGDEEGNEQEDEEAEGEIEEDEGERDGDSGQAKKDQACAEAKRGKKGKLKKMKKKYQDQDEEDRELALMALGSRPAPKSKEPKGAKGSKANKKAPPRDARLEEKLVGDLATLATSEFEVAWTALPPSVQMAIDRLVSSKVLKFREDIGSVELRALDNLGESDALQVLEAFRGADFKKTRNRSAVLAREIQRFVGQQKAVVAQGDALPEPDLSLVPPAQSAPPPPPPQPQEQEPPQPLSRRAMKKAEEEELAQMLEAEGVVTLDPEDEEALSEERELLKLTGNPHPNDVLLFAIPVCAPYSSLLNHYKYRVKLTPGAMKKGKAAHQALDIFIRSKDATPREVDLMKAINDNELVACMMGDVKVSKPGMQATLSQAKKSKTKSGKG